MCFDARQETISNLLNNAVYRIPRNQRKYVWKKDNWKDLWTDVVFVSENQIPHFIGSIVLKEEGAISGLEQYTIIDGQQRMMTVSIFLLAIMFIMKTRGMIDDFDGCVKYLITTDRKNRNNHIFNADYHESFEKMIDSLIDMPTDDIKYLSISSFINLNTVSKRKDKIIGDAVKFFFDQLNEYLSSNKENPGNAIVSLLDALVGMNYVHIRATTEEDSYTIFEILNARGQPLEDHDLLKNYIMRYIQPIENRDKVKKAWEQMEDELGKGMSNFIKHYAPHRYATSEELRKEPYKNIRKSSDNKDMEKLLRDIQLKCKYYSKIYKPRILDDDDVQICTQMEFFVFSFFKTKRQEQFRPILLTLMHQRELEKISEDRYNFVLNFLYKFFLCYTIIGKEKSNRLTDVIYKYAPLLEARCTDELLDEFISNLKSKIPSVDWFINAFRNIGWSNHWGLYKDSAAKQRAKLVLEVLEKHLSNCNLDIDYTIEHIYPDSEHEDNAKIGNLIPLEQTLNERCKKKPLNEKILIYEESGFYTVRGIAKKYKSKHKFDIDKRTDYLAKLFYDEILAIK